MALFATPLRAQEAPLSPPPVEQPAPPAASSPAPAGPSAADRAKYEASLGAATGPAALAEPADAPIARQPAARRVPPARAAASVRAVPVARAAPSAPVAAAPTPAAAPAATPPADAPVAPSVAAVPDPIVTREQTTIGGLAPWAWVVGGLAVLGLAVFGWLALRRRREDAAWAEAPVAHDDALAAAPPSAEPVAEHVEIVPPEAAEVAAITGAAAPVAGRPWIELSFRPLRAGTTDDSAIIELELTLANAGAVAARDVRVATFMLGDAGAAPTEPDRLLAVPHADTEVRAGEIAAGEGSRVDATLAIPRDGLDGATFQPVVVAEVRYALPDGGEGRTVAAFAVGGDDGSDRPTPLRLGGDMREDVVAMLHGVPQRT